jgi:hypothetical protein
MHSEQTTQMILALFFEYFLIKKNDTVKVLQV